MPPVVPVIVIADVLVGQVKAVLLNVKSVGGSNAIIVMLFVANVQLIASFTIIVYVPLVKFEKVANAWKLTPSIL